MENSCNICYDEINDDKLHVCQLKCNSIYHKSCARSWAYKVNTCPNCRENIDSIHKGMSLFLSLIISK